MIDFMSLFGSIFEPSGYKKMSSKDAIEYMKNNKDYVILDVRTKEEYKHGRIPKAINIPLDIISEKNLSKIKNKDKTIFVYCHSGGRSSQACNILSKLGYKNIIDIGGIIFWKGKIER